MIANVIILATGVLQTITLGALLLQKKARKAGFGFLVIYLCVITAQLLFKIAEKSWLMSNMRLGYSISYHLPFLYGPLIWLFARSMMKSANFHPSNLLHFLPFTIAAALEIIPEFDERWHWIYLPFFSWSGTAAHIISLAWYHIESIRLWQAYNAGIKSHFSDIHVIRMLWVKKIIIFSFAVCTFIAVMLTVIYKTHPDFTFLRWSFLLLVLFIYWISYTAMQHPQVFTHVVNRSFVSRVERAEFPLFTVKKSEGRYASSHLSEDEALRIESMLTDLMQNHRLFADPSLSIDKLATRLHSNRHFLSQVLNQRIGQSFYDYVNSFRVEEAKHQLCQPSNAHLKISSIAYDAGFNSLSAFNEVFRKTTGVTPSVFRKTGSAGEQQQESAG